MDVVVIHVLPVEMLQRVTRYWTNCAGSLDFSLWKLLVLIDSSSKHKWWPRLPTIINPLIYGA